MSPSRSHFLAGVKAELPILFGVMPFGMIYGLLALDAGLSAQQTQAMSVIVFAGSAQFIMAQLFQSATPALVIVATAALVNLRHALYSASMTPYVKHVPPLWRALGAYFLTDEAYAVSISHFRSLPGEKGKFSYFLGAGLALWTTWQLSTAAGILVGAQLPDSWSLDFFLPLGFIALLIPVIDEWPSGAAALCAGITAVIAYPLPYKLGLVLAAAVGIAVGLGAETLFRTPSGPLDNGRRASE